MNTESKDTLTIAITGVLTIEPCELEQLLARSFQLTPANPAPNARTPAGEAKPAPMGLTVKQAAEALGVGQATIYRLLRRGLLRSSLALRTKIIPRTEIERFLKETTRSEY